MNACSAMSLQRLQHHGEAPGAEPGPALGWGGRRPGAEPGHALGWGGRPPRGGSVLESGEVEGQWADPRLVKGRVGAGTDLTFRQGRGDRCECQLSTSGQRCT